MGDRIDPERLQKIVAERDRNAPEPRSLDEHQLRPAEQKCRQRAPSLSKIRVDATGLRQRRGKLGERQRPAQRDYAARGP